MQNDNNSDLPKKGVTPPLARLERVKRWLIRALPAFGVGLVAGLCCAVCMLILRLAACISTPGELFCGIVLFWTELRQNFFGLPILWSRLTSALGLGLDFGVYALVLGWGYRACLPQQPKAGRVVAVQERRTLLARVGVAVLGIGAGVATLGLANEYANNNAFYYGLPNHRHR